MNFDGLLKRGVVDVIGVEALEKKLSEGRVLRIKLGIDPTGSDLHLGHSVVLRKLREFQDLGHTVILLIGDYTARIGDPTGKSETRAVLSEEAIRENMKNYLLQAGKILDTDKLEVRYNSEWFGVMTMIDILKLTGLKTVNQMLQREDFRNRYQSGQDISLTELLYPMMQGYDSVMLDCDVEIGGTDQLFNMLVGRDLQKAYEIKKQQAVITVPLLEGLSGGKKMSKSLGNYVGITESAADMYGKIMSIVDDLIVVYFELLTNLEMKKISEIKQGVAEGQNPRDYKMWLARELVAFYHNAAEAEKAEVEFVNIFKNKGLPDEIELVELDKEEWGIVDLITFLKLVSSKSEARRLVEGGGVKIDGEKIADIGLLVTLSNDIVLLQVGKRAFRKIKLKR